jgi:hypothetical protein
VWLTPDQAREVAATFGAALEPVRDRNSPDDTRRVRVLTMLTPHPKR